MKIELSEYQAGAIAASPELNRLIAEYVMGYTVYNYDKDIEQNCYFMLMDGDFDPVYTGRHRDGERKTEAEAWADAPDFSSDMRAAWLVADRLTAVGLRPVQMPDWNGSWHTVLYRKADYLVQTTWDKSAAVGICRAALLMLVKHGLPEVERASHYAE